MLESQPKAQKTMTLVYLPKKTSAQRLGPRQGNMNQNGPKTTYDVTHKNAQPTTKKFFSECRLED